MPRAIKGQSTLEGSLIEQEDFEAWFTKWITELGYIPAISDWLSNGFPYDHTTTSRYLRRLYPDVTSNRLKQFLNDTIPEGYFYLGRKTRGGRFFTVRQNLDELIRYIEDFKAKAGRVPYAIEYKLESRKRPQEYNLMRQESLQEVLEVGSYSAILAYLGYDAVEVSNQHYHDKMAALGIPHVKEDTLILEGRQYRIDYCLTLPEGHVWLEIDGSSHYTPNSPYHTNPSTRDGDTAQESFENKVKRDERLNLYFKENNLPLVRISHFHFVNIDAPAFYRLIEAARSTGFVRTYKIFRKEVPDRIAELIKQGLGVSEISQEMGLANKTLSSYIYRHGLKCLYQEFQSIRQARRLGTA